NGREFHQGLLQEIQRDGPTRARMRSSRRDRGTRGKRWWLRKAAGEITGPCGPSAWRVAVQRWTERYLAALFCEARRLRGHARECPHHPLGSGMEDACGLS